VLSEGRFKMDGRRLKWSWPPAPGDTTLTIVCYNGLDPTMEFDRARLTVRKSDFAKSFMENGWQLPASVPGNLPLIFRCTETFPDGKSNTFEVNKAGSPLQIDWFCDPTPGLPHMTRVSIRYPAELPYSTYPEGMLYFVLRRDGVDVERFPLPRPDQELQTFWYEMPEGTDQLALMLDGEKQFAGGRYRVENCFRLQKRH